jgi:hypothetical protein
VYKIPKTVLRLQGINNCVRVLAVGLLEQPIELISGKREKKKVERLSMTLSLPSSEKKKVEIVEGKGTKLGDCPRGQQTQTFFVLLKTKTHLINNLAISRNI